MVGLDVSRMNGVPSVMRGRRGYGKPGLTPRTYGQRDNPAKCCGVYVGRLPAKHKLHRLCGLRFNRGRQFLGLVVGALLDGEDGINK